MLTTAQVDHFRTFGFTVLSGYLADRVSALRGEADAAIRDAYATHYDERVIDGISGHYLPMASRLTPVSASLVCDDPRLIDAAGQVFRGFDTGRYPIWRDWLADAAHPRRAGVIERMRQVGALDLPGAQDGW